MKNFFCFLQKNTPRDYLLRKKELKDLFAEAEFIERPTTDEKTLWNLKKTSQLAPRRTC